MLAVSQAMQPKDVFMQSSLCEQFRRSYAQPNGQANGQGAAQGSNPQSGGGAEAPAATDAARAALAKGPFSAHRQQAQQGQKRQPEVRLALLPSAVFSFALPMSPELFWLAGPVCTCTAVYYSCLTGHVPAGLEADLNPALGDQGLPAAVPEGAAVGGGSALEPPRSSGSRGGNVGGANGNGTGTWSWQSFGGCAGAFWGFCLAFLTTELPQIASPICVGASPEPPSGTWPSSPSAGASALCACFHCDSHCTVPTRTCLSNWHSTL